MAGCLLKSHLGALGKDIISSSLISQELLQILLGGQINLYKCSKLKI